MVENSIFDFISNKKEIKSKRKIAVRYFTSNNLTQSIIQSKPSEILFFQDMFHKTSASVAINNKITTFIIFIQILKSQHQHKLFTHTALIIFIMVKGYFWGTDSTFPSDLNMEFFLLIFSNHQHGFSSRNVLRGRGCVKFPSKQEQSQLRTLRNFSSEDRNCLLRFLPK